MTYKEKLMQAHMAMHRIKILANTLYQEAESYDTKWPKQYAKEIEVICDNLINKL